VCVLEQLMIKPRLLSNYGTLEYYVETVVKLYLYIYIYIFICAIHNMYKRTYIHICVCIYTYIYIHMCVCIHMYIYTGVCICIDCLFVRVCACMRVCEFARMCVISSHSLLSFSVRMGFFAI